MLVSPYLKLGIVLQIANQILHQHTRKGDQMHLYSLADPLILKDGAACT
jgi:hypothetical protein